MEQKYKARISAYLNLLSEIETKTVDEVLASYADKSDDFIETDLLIQEKMAEAYHTVVTLHKDFDLRDKIQVYKSILILTMAMADDLSGLIKLPEDMLKEITSEFKNRVLPAIQASVK